MKNVCTMVKIAIFVNSDECWYVSITIDPSCLTNARRIFGSRLMKTTKIKGARKAISPENHPYFSTGCLRKGSIFVSESTFDIPATKLTGTVQKIHSKVVNTKLVSSPICLLVLLFPIFFQLI